MLLCNCSVLSFLNWLLPLFLVLQCLFSLKLPNCKSMPLDTRQRDLPPQLCFEDNAAWTVPLPELGRPYAPELQARCLQPSPLQSLLWSHHDKESWGKRFSMSDMRSWCAAAAATPHGALESSQKGLMIFDQSGNLIAGSSMKYLPLELSWEATKPLWVWFSSGWFTRLTSARYVLGRLYR